MHQPAGGALVDVLGGADESGAGHLDLEQHVGVVTSVAGEAIDLPDDDVVNVALLLDAPEHDVQFGALVGLGRLGALDVLIDHDSAVLGCLLRAALALRSDRQAIVVVVGLQLSARADPQIEHSSFDGIGWRGVSHLGKRESHRGLLTVSANTVVTPARAKCCRVAASSAGLRVR
ncbi:MAG TPA: hypothetical protein VG147_08025 [Solirubrobacteraceae bacterium]|nr:hypothetical protein [Solirubrobacteraceae bacterium]